ncbi:hypothetical protein [Pantoea sp. 18069]|uniref:hypothetical protein n=1 Tax=Pantoea sp. 18069 TaxID=2681415 RepID=UPI001359E295|nr:hypothetical protein [Pantoea sp. 18069]
MDAWCAPGVLITPLKAAGGCHFSSFGAKLRVAPGAPQEFSALIQPEITLCRGSIEHMKFEKIRQ